MRSIGIWTGVILMGVAGALTTTWIGREYGAVWFGWILTLFWGLALGSSIRHRPQA